MNRILRLAVAARPGAPGLGSSLVGAPDLHRAAPLLYGVPGTAPAQMETEVARKIENSLATVQGIKHIYSTIQDGTATLTAAGGGRREGGAAPWQRRRLGGLAAGRAERERVVQPDTASARSSISRLCACTP